MMDYAALNLSTWALFACLRVIIWTNLTNGDQSVYNATADRLLCRQTREAIRLASCQPATEREFAAFCASRASEAGGADRMDCDNMSPAERMGLRKRMKGCTS